MAGETYHLDDIVDSLEAGKAVAFLGSGISVGARLPAWPELLNKLVEVGLRERRLDESQKKELAEWSPATDYLMRADAIQRRLTPALFQDFMVKTFNSAGTRPTDVHRTLAGLPFAAFITTNFDRLFEHAWSEVHHDAIAVITHKDRQALRDPFGPGTPFLMKTHGCASRPDTLVLGLKEFRESIHDNRACQFLLQRIFLQYQVLFIGHSLTDPDLLFLLDQLVGNYGMPPRQHVALIKKADVGPLRAETFLENYGIRIETYDASDHHPEVLEFIQQIRRRVRTRIENFSRDLLHTIEEQRTEPRRAEVSIAPPAPPAPPAAWAPGRYAEKTLRDYGRKHLEAGVWAKLAGWYDGLDGSIEQSLLRINLDRECEREDLSPEIWQEFLRRLAAHQPTRERPLAALNDVVEEDPGLFVLKGRKIEGAFRLYRYMALPHLVEMLKRQKVDGDSTAAALENGLLGRPGRPVWCSDATYAAESDPVVIANDLWPYAVPPQIAEIAYSTETLLPDNFLRVATIPDIYWSAPEFINIKKPPAGTSGWSHTIRLDDQKLAERAPSALHAPLRLLSARTEQMKVRVVG